MEKSKHEILSDMAECGSDENLTTYFSRIIAGIKNLDKEAEVRRIEQESLLHYKDSAEWTEKERLFQGKPFTFKDCLEPWIPWHKDPHRSIIVRKARQLTFSEQVMCKVFHRLVTKPYEAVLHTFHQEGPAADFSKDRYAAAINSCKQVKDAQRRHDVHSRSFEFRDGDEQFLYILGTKSNRKDSVAGSQVLSKTPGMIIFDERQDQDANVTTYVGESLGFKPDAKVITGGTSRTPGNPLEVEFQQSDQKLCLYKCPKCGTWNRPEVVLNGRDWICPNIITLDDPIEDMFGNPKRHLMCCQKCKHDIDHYRGKYGPQPDGGKVQWVSQRLDKFNRPYQDYFSGYYFTRFEVGFYNLTNKVISPIEDVTRTVRAVSNDVLGLPYAGDDCPYNMTVLNGCKAVGMHMDKARRIEYRLKIGTLDWGYAPGSYCYVEGILHDWRGVCLGWNCIQGDELKHGEMAAQWFKSMGCTMVICDWGYKAGREADLIKAFGKHNVFLCMYDTGTGKSLTLDEHKHVNLSKTIDEGIVIVDRNFAIESLQRNLSGGTDYWIIPYADPGIIDPYLLQFTNIYKEDPREGMSDVEIWRDTFKYKRSGPDHTAHCKIMANLVNHPDLRRLFDREMKVV